MSLSSMNIELFKSAGVWALVVSNVISFFSTLLKFVEVKLGPILAIFLSSKANSYLWKSTKVLTEATYVGFQMSLSGCLWRAPDLPRFRPGRLFSGT